VSTWDVIEKPDEYKLEINSGTRERLKAFVTMIKSYRVMMQSNDAYEVAKYISLNSGLLRDLNEDKTPEGISRYENIEELLNGIKEFTEMESEVPVEPGTEKALKTLGEYMQDIALLTDADADDKDDTDKVSLMTIHQAKGLEFPYVYIAGVEENLFPGIQSLSSRADLEEERRLFYVAITRAMEKLTISYAESRYKYGQVHFSEQSRFIDEIDEEYIEFPGSVVIPKKSFQKAGQEDVVKSPMKMLIKKPDTSRLTRLSKLKENGIKTSAGDDNHSDLLQSGMDVEHERFGKGKILNIEGSGSNRKATVFFQQIGQKQLLLKFARLKILK
jgi:DNA helicase II / ATP-dependent DNA helicase PcrA